jgi:hypothetical protein
MKLIIIISQLLLLTKCSHASDLKIFTVATEETDGYIRMKRSAEQYNLDLTTLGLGSLYYNVMLLQFIKYSGAEWTGGDVKHTTGGGQKIRLLRDALEPYSQDTNTMIMFTDA